MAQMIDNEADFGDILDAPEEVQTAAKFRPKQWVKPRKATLLSRSVAPNPTVEICDGKAGALSQGNSSEELISQGKASLMCPGSETVDEVAGCQGIIDTPSENILGSLNNCAVACDSHEIVQTSDSEAVLATDHSTVDDLANLDSVLEEPVQKETPANFRPKLRLKPGKDSSRVAGTNDNVASEPHVGIEKGKGKSVYFVLPDDSEGVSPTDINSEMGNFSYSCNDTSIDEKLNDSPQQTAKKHCITKEQYSNAQQHTDKESQSHEMEPSDHAVEQQPKSDVRETGSSMKLRSRKKLQNVGIAEHIADDYFGEDNVEPSAAEQDDDSCNDYNAGGKRMVRRKSRDGINKEPPRDSMCIEETHQKVKSQVSSRGRKRTLNNEATEKPEKKLTHRIRQKRMKEVKTLLETPDKIVPMKLSATHLRLLQEIRERVKGKELASGPSSNTSSQFEDIDDFESYRDKEAENFDDDRTENNALQNATKLNYHSYMNKQTRAKWSKSDTDLFYKGLRQFGSDFAMIQQLFPDKICHQVRQKFKMEEKKNPMLVHDAVIRRSGDNVYFKKVIKQLNIEDVLPEINNTHKQESTSNEGDPENENALDGFIDEEDDFIGTRSPDVQEEHVSGNAEDDLGDVFDWY